MSRSSYHHGDLANTLRHVAAEVIAERGAAGFSLREVARRAGVSHAAPTHHYGDATGLLTAVAIEAFEHLHRAMTSAVVGVEDPVERLVLIGRAYVEVARSNPGHCAVVFRHDLVDSQRTDYRDAGGRAYDALRDTVAEVAASINPSLDVEVASRLCWSTVQGLVQLHSHMAEMALVDGLEPVEELGDMAETFGRMLVDGLRAG